MNIHVFALPYDSALRGYRMGAGPERLLNAGLVGHLEKAGHKVQVELIEVPADPPPVEVRTAFELDRALAGRVREATAAGRFPLVLAGNCISSVGTLSGLSPEPTGIVWFDSHADLNTPDTTESAFLDGMALSVALGRCWKHLASSVPGFRPVPERDVLLLGARDLDPAEAEFLTGSAITHLRPAEFASALEPALESLSSRVTGVHVHLDLDVLDPGEGRVNQFAAPDGPTVAQMAETLRAIARRLPVRAAAFTAYDPAYDGDGRVARAALTLLDALTTES